MWKTKFTPKVVRQDDRHIRVEIWNEVEEVGTLYFERPKVGWTKKPISTGEWVCVDAHIENFAHEVGGNPDNFQPKDIIEWAREAIKDSL